MLGTVASPPRRALFVDALTKAAAESGYAEVDVEKVADYAGLSVESFYQYFEDLDQCLLASLDRFLQRLNQQMDAAWGEGDDWPWQVKASIRAGIEFAMEVEGASRVFLVDATGPAAIERRMTAVGRAAEALKKARDLYPVTAGYPEIMEQTLVAGVVLVVCSHLLAEKSALSPLLAEEVVELVLTPYVGREEARRVSIDV